jgi:nucleoside-diphosphate-sugar epimerase
VKKKTYLITGGNGFIGSAIIKKLIAENVNIISFDSNLRGNIRKLGKAKNNIKIKTGDIRDLKKLVKVSKKVDSIIHLAFLNGTEYFYSKPELVLDIGVKGIINVIDACKINKIKELILASSSEVYQIPKKIPTDENVIMKIPDVYNPRYSYAAGKIISEVLAINNSKFFKKLMIFRPHNVYGSDMGFEHVIPQIILRMNKLKKSSNKINFKIQGDGNETRSFNHIDDFVDGFLTILKKGKHLNIYNIGTQEEIKIKDLTNLIAKNLNHNINIQKSSLSRGSTRRRCPDISKLKKLGYSPKIKLKDGIKEVIKWYTNQANLINELK